jgi:putative RecB family exonuclease
MTGYKNEHLSFSRLTRFETCPLSYKLHYIDKRQPEPGLPLRFGKLIHAVVERLVREAVDDERSGPLAEDRVLALYRDGWTAEGLSGVDVFQEGLEILQRFVRDQGVLEHRNVLAVEKEFRLPVGPFTVLGFIDRVDCVDAETIEIIDYKTNRQLFTRDEVDATLQMSLYELAARRLWPWVKKVKLTFWMLRHGIRQGTGRTREQLEAATAYVETLGKQTETATQFPPRLNTNCSYCDHRSNCPAYADALRGKREFICEDLADLEAVAREREEVARLSKALYARKEELEKVLKAHLKEHDELFLAGVRYRMFHAEKLEYPLEATLDSLGRATGKSGAELVATLAAIDNKALDDFLKRLAKETDKNRVALLKAELEAAATKTHIPRFWAKEVAA